MKNMLKFSLFLSLLFFSLNSCKDKNRIDDSSSSSIENSHLTISEIHELIPEEYSNNPKVHFTNEQGENIILNTKYNLVQKNKTHNDKNYTSDHLEIFLESDNRDIVIIMASAVNYQNENDIASHWFAQLFSIEHTNHLTSVDFFFDNGSMIYPTTPPESMTLLSKDFSEVYTNPPSTHDSLSEIYYNTEFGVIGFKDTNNELFVLDYIE